jgi:histidine triad (HIT) family protein
VSDDFYCREVLNGRVAVEKLVETDNVLAFHHTRPAYPVHIVVIPKRHIASLLDLADKDDPLLVEMFAIMKQMAAQVVKAHGACRVVTNLGSYQDSAHLHWHVISGERFQP